MTSSKERGKSSSISKAYLILYNVVQTVGWTFLFYKYISHYMDDSFNKPELYDTVKVPLFIFQNLAVLEVVHAFSKLVKANPIITLLQVTSRVFVVCLILAPTEMARDSVGFPLLMSAWTITEIIRYSNYALSLVNAVPYFLVWLRYSTFIILYPIGVTGELLCQYAAYQETTETQLWSFSMPNKWNVIFSFPYLIIFSMLMYIPNFPQLYLHMFSQRRKVLGGVKEKKH